MEKENVGIDYEYRCRCLEEEINRLKEENDIKLKCSEEKRLDIERELQKVEDKIKAKIEELENEKEKYFEKQVIQHEIDVLQSLLNEEE